MRVSLNGWQRLWVVACLLSLGLATGFVYYTYRSSSRVEDPAILTQLNDSQVVDIQIPGLGRLKFPNNMSENDIAALIRQNVGKNLNKIEALAKVEIQRRNEQQAAESRKANDVVRRADREALLLGYGIWLAFVILLYIAGWCVGWVYRGFKAA